MTVIPVETLRSMKRLRELSCKTRAKIIIELLLYVM